MIQFFIENQEVILPDDFSFTQIDENPLITNNGEFTLDITVSLRNGENAKAAKFINRINKIDIDTSYNALMIDDGKYKHGTIIIQSHTNTDMTFQFVAGNSELNYLAKNDKKIWELDWGTESAIDYARALASLNQTGWFETDSGAENLLVGSAVIAFGSGAALMNDQSEKYYRSVLMSSNSYKISGGQYTYPVTSQQYINSVWIKLWINGPRDIKIYNTLNPANSSKTFTVSSGTWMRIYTHPFFATGVGSITLEMVNGVVGDNIDWDYKKAKIEIGTHVTNWIPAKSELFNFVCAPVLLGEEIVNDYTVVQGVDGVLSHITGITDKIIMQPYLMYYVRKLPELLGYTLDYNALINDSRAKKMYLINSVDSLSYADLLPDMTITEFIQAIENFFNVTFIIDKTTKKLSISTLSSSIANKVKIKLSNTLDNFTRNLSEDSKSVKLDFTRVSYDLSDNDYYQYQQLNDEILARCTVKEFNTFTELYVYIQMNYGIVKVNEFVIYRDLQYNNDYFIFDETSFPTKISLYNQAVPTLKKPKLVNKLASVGTSTTRELILKLIPSALLPKYKTVTYLDTHLQYGTYTQKCYYQLPSSSSNYYLVETQSKVIDAVENGLKTVPRIDKIEVAMYSGMVVTYVENRPPKLPTTDARVPLDLLTYPFSHIDILPEFRGSAPAAANNYNGDTPEFDSWVTNFYKFRIFESMRLKGNNGIVKSYQIENVLDTSKEYDFEIPDSPYITADNIFEYKNQNYIPISLERTKSRKKGLVKGTFYRML